MSLKDYQLYMFNGEDLADGVSTIVEPTKTSDIGKTTPPLYLVVAISGATGTATAPIQVTLGTGTTLDRSATPATLTDSLPVATYYIPKERLTRGGTVLVVPIPPFLRRYHQLTLAGVAASGLVGGTIAATYAQDGDMTNLL